MHFSNHVVTALAIAAGTASAWEKQAEHTVTITTCESEAPKPTHVIPPAVHTTAPAVQPGGPIQSVAPGAPAESAAPGAPAQPAAPGAPAESAAPGAPAESAAP
ncbi:uncharacterized protein BDW43DRAFT_317302, partial [Aspergillus alliaceus]